MAKSGCRWGLGRCRRRAWLHCIAFRRRHAGNRRLTARVGDLARGSRLHAQWRVRVSMRRSRDVVHSRSPAMSFSCVRERFPAGRRGDPCDAATPVAATNATIDARSTHLALARAGALLLLRDRGDGAVVTGVRL